MEFKEKIALLFEVTFSAKTTDEIINAQKALAQCSLEPSFLESVFGIINDSNKNPEMKARLRAIKKAATLYLKKFIDEKLESDEIKHDEIYFFSQIICNGLYHSHVSMDNKIQFVIILNQLILHDLTGKIKNDLRSSVLQNLSSHSQLENHQKIGLFLVIRALLGGLNSAVDISAFFEEIKGNFFHTARQIMLFNSSDFKLLLKQLKVLKIWVETLRNFVMKLSDFKSSAMETILIYPDIAELSFEIVKLTFPLNKQLEDCMISTTSSKNLNDTLNEIKFKTLKLVNILMRFLVETKNEKAIAERSNFFNMIPFLIELIYKSMIKYFSQTKESLSGFNEGQTLESLMIQSFVFLRLACNLNEHNSFYQMNYQTIFFDTLLPFLVANNEELMLFKESPEKFLSFTLDTCNRKESETLKSAICLFIQSLARHVDGFLTFAFSLMKEILVFSVLSNNIAELQTTLMQSYTALKQFIYYKSAFLSQTSQEARIETSLLTFAVLHEEIIKRNDLKNSLEKIIVNHEEALLNKKNTTEFIRGRMCLLFGCCGAVLFSEESNHTFFKYLKYVVNSVKSKKKIAVSVTILAIDSLLKTIFNKKLKKRNSYLIKDMFKIFVNKFPKVSYPQFYDLIALIIKNFKRTLSKNSTEDLLALFRSLTKLIVLRLNKCLKKTKKKGLLLKKSFDVLEEIIDSRALSPVAMEEELIVLYEILENPNKIRLEREIFTLIVRMIEVQGAISPALEKMFPILPNCFRIHDFDLQVIFQVLNCFLYYGKSFVGSNMKTVEQILDLTLFCLKGTEDHNDEVNQGLAALILQAMILNYHEIFSFEFWEKVFSKIMERMALQFENKFLRGCICNVIWASFFVKFEFVQEFLTKFNKLGYIMAFLMQQGNVYSTEYDKKLFILGACSVFNSPFIDDSILSYSSKLFETLISALVGLSQSSKRKKSTIPGKMITEQENDDSDILEDFGDEGESEMGDDLDNKLLDIQLEYTEEVNQIYSYINKTDEFDAFQRTITALKARNTVFLQNLIGLLPEATQQELKDILHSRRVIIDEKENSSVPRKILKVVGIKKN